jgi:hypothetical protein
VSGGAGARARPRAEDEGGGFPEVPGYRLRRLLGRGAQGAVFLAETRDDLKKEVALKYFPPLGRGAYRRELETWRAIEDLRRELRCEELVEGYAAFELASGAACIAMAYFARGTLADAVRARGPLAEAEAAAHTTCALRALEALHGRGLYHKDVKPSNLLLGQDGRARLGDFGLARDLEASATAGGTPAFAAPELFLLPGRVDGVRADVYSAGATLHFLLTGAPPFPGRPDLFALERCGVGRALQKALIRALREEPELRFESARAFREAIEAAERAATPRPGSRLRARWGAALAAAAVALAVAIIVVERSKGRAAPRAEGAASRADEAPSAADLAALADEEPVQAAFADGAFAAIGPGGRVVLFPRGGPRRAIGTARRVALFAADLALCGVEDGSLKLDAAPPARAHAGPVAALAVHRGRALAASAGAAGDVRLFRVSRGGLAPIGRALEGDGALGLAALAFDASGERIAVGRTATGGGAGTPRVQVYPVSSEGIGREPLATFGDLPPFAALAFLPGGDVATGALDGRIAVLGVGRPPLFVRAFASSIDWIAPAPGGTLVAAGDDRALRVLPLGEALVAGEILVAEEDGRRMAWPRARQGRVRMYDAAALARGAAVVQAEHAVPGRQ